MTASDPASDAKVMKLGPLWFQPGITGWNFATLSYAGFSTISMISFISFIQPYLLTEILHMPAAEQGTFTGLLHSLQEALVILSTGFIGAWSDRTGRRIIFVVGFVVMALGYLIMPLADSAAQLIVFRCLFAVGTAMVPIMLSASIVDYIQERSRGRWLGISSIFTGAGAVFMALVLAKTPDMYLNAGADTINAGRYAYWTGAAMCGLAAVVLWFGLSRKKPIITPRGNVAAQLYAGMRAGIDNPKLMLAYCAAFIGRGDLAIVTAFFSLWISQEGADIGISTADALARAGMMYGLLQFAAMLWAPVMGYISDRVTRVTGLAIAMGLAAAGYFAMGQIEDPFGSSLLPAAILLGIGEVSVIVAAGTLMGQEAKPEIRGAIVGVYGLMGGLGIMLAMAAGGLLFDNVARTAPFTMMAIANGVLMVAALAMRGRGK
jgi:MFS family permease